MTRHYLKICPQFLFQCTFSLSNTYGQVYSSSHKCSKSNNWQTINQLVNKWGVKGQTYNCQYNTNNKSQVVIERTTSDWVVTELYIVGTTCLVSLLGIIETFCLCRCMGCRRRCYAWNRYIFHKDNILCNDSDYY